MAGVDCDDNDAANFPGNTEICDGQDNDCNSLSDFDVAGEVDADSDGSISCEDCDDSDPNATPGAAELCDGVDSDCAGGVPATWVASLPANSATDPNRLRSLVFEATADALITSYSATLNAPAGAEVTFALYEGATATGPFLPVVINEVFVPAALAGAANDISSGGIGYQLQTGSFYAFAMFWGSEAITRYWDTTVTADPAWGTWISSQGLDGITTLPASLTGSFGVNGQYGYTIVTDDEGDADNDSSVACADCDDGDPTNFPSNTEVCDGFDNDCLGGPDFDAAGEIDGDNDTVISCNDCDDSDPSAFPGNTEACDGVDNDCDATTEAAGGETDDDLDTWINCADCAELDGAVNPGAIEICDGLDTNCNAAAGMIYTTAGLTDPSNGTNRVRGNVFLATEDTLLSSFSMELAADAGDELTWAVYQAGALTGTFTLVDEHATEVAPLLDGVLTFHSSLPFGVELEAGSYYALAAHWTADTDYGWNSTFGLPFAMTWGSHVAGMAEDNHTSLPSTLTGDNTFAYRMMVTTDDEVDGDSDTVFACADCDDSTSAVAPGLAEVCDDLDNDCSGAVDNFDLSGSDSPGTVISSSGANTITATMESFSTGVIADVDVTVDISHTYAGDLVISLISPTGTSIELSSENGGSSNNYSVTTFDDDASTAITSGSAPFNGAYSPEDPLATLNGESPLGVWTLSVADLYNQDGGTLNSWSIEIGLDPGASVGFNESCSAQDCDAIMTADPLSTDGIYWIDPMGYGPFETFCDQSNDGGGWTLVANIDDVSDPFFGGNTTPFQSAWVNAWESASTRNMTMIPTFTSDVSVSTKYYSFSELIASDVRIAYKNDGAYFLCEGLDVNDTLDVLFDSVPPSDDCTSVCTTWSSDRFSASEMPTGQGGVNCNDGNDGWWTTDPAGENARIGARMDVSVYAGFVGAMGDRGYSTNTYEKTWGAFNEGVVVDDNIMLFVR